MRPLHRERNIPMVSRFSQSSATELHKIERSCHDLSPFAVIIQADLPVCLLGEVTSKAIKHPMIEAGYLSPQFLGSLSKAFCNHHSIFKFDIQTLNWLTNYRYSQLR